METPVSIPRVSKEDLKLDWAEMFPLWYGGGFALACFLMWSFFSPALLIPLFLTSIICLGFVSSVLKEKKRVINEIEYFNEPNEVIDNFIEWEQGDRIYINSLNSYVDSWGLKLDLDDNFSSTFYYQGVLDDGTLLLSKNRKLERKERLLSDTNKVIRCTPGFIRVSNAENESLKKRKQKRITKEAKKRIDNSKKMEVIEEAQSELKKIRSD